MEPGRYVDPASYYEAAAEHCARLGYSDSMLVRALLQLPEEVLADIEADPAAFARRVQEYAYAFHMNGE